LRGGAPHFFWLVSSLLKDALILGLDNLLDRPKKGVQLTIEHIVNSLTDPNTQKACKERLSEIRASACCRDVTIARNHLIAHPNRLTLLRRDEISTKVEFQNLKITDLENLLRQVTDLAGLALGKPASEFSFPDWEGVSQLFDRLRHLSSGQNLLTS